MSDDRPSTIPEAVIGKLKYSELRQVPVRMHPHEHTLLRTLLKRDRMSIQKLHNYLISGYLNADPRILSYVKEQRELEAVPKDIQDSHVIPWRERLKIFDEIEKEGNENETE